MFDEFSIYDVMSLVGLDLSKIHSSQGNFDCPICGGKKKLNVNVSKGHGGVCRCAKCGAGGDKLDLYLLFQNPHLVSVRSKSESDYYRPSEEDREQGLKELARILHIQRKDPTFRAKVITAKQAADTAAPQKAIASAEQRNAAYTALLKQLRLSAPHREALHQRGLTDADIERIMFRSVPMFGRTVIAQKLVEQGINLENVPGFFKVAGENGKLQWSIFCPNPGYFVPIRNKDGLIVSMQIRLNKATTEKTKYLFFSSGIDTLTDGISATGEVHIERGEEPPRIICITEGPIKGYVSRSLYQRLTGRDDLALFCVVGTTNYGKIRGILESYLEQYPVEKVVEIYDFDKFTNPYVSRDRDHLEQLLREVILKMRKKLRPQYEEGKPLPMYISFPEERYKGKGIDDHFLALYLEAHDNCLPCEVETD